MTKFILKMAAAMLLGFAALSASAGSDIQIHDPWVQAAPPGVKVLAAYLEIKNSGKKQWVLNSVASPAFGEVGIHRSVIHGNMAHMEHLKELASPANTSVTLQPGGLHFMLMDPKKPLNEGDKVPMTLTFSNGEKIAVAAIVRSGKKEGMEDNQKMDHSGHGGHMH